MKKFTVRLLCFLLPIMLAAAPLLFVGCITGELLRLDCSIKKQQKDQEILLGMVYNDAEAYYKLKNAKHEQAEVITLGTSRVLQFSAQCFQTDFYNCGRGVTYNFDEYVNFLKNLDYTPKVVILGLDQWLFNDAYTADFPTWKEYRRITYQQRELMEIIRTMVDDHQAGKWCFHDLWNYPQNCGLGGRVKNNGYRWDGSYYYGSDYRDTQTTAEKRLEDTFERIRNKDGRFQGGTTVSESSLALLEKCLAYCRMNGIEVVGFFPPFAPAVYAAMSESGNYVYMEQLMQKTEPLFQKYGYELFDYSDGEALEISDDSFIDGFHGSEIVYDLILQDMGNTSEVIADVIDKEKLLELYEQRYSELTFSQPF